MSVLRRKTTATPASEVAGGHVRVMSQRELAQHAVVEDRSRHDSPSERPTDPEPSS